MEKVFRASERGMDTLLLALLLSAATPGQSPSPPPTPTTVSVRGTIDQYESATRMLSLSTSHGIVRFALSTSTRIRNGWHKIDGSELARLAGERATVRYTQAGYAINVESVHVFAR
jgi:hypothetical protein